MSGSSINDLHGRPADGAQLSNMESCVLFLLGSERSGTTFVQETFSRFYPVSQGNESQWVVSAWRRAQKADLDSMYEQQRFLRWIFSDWYFANKANYHNVYFDYKNHLQSGSFDFSRFVEGVFQHIAAAEGNQWVLNKTCMFLEHMDVVDAVFHQPRVVHLVRDGRDVGLSLLKTKAWGPVTPYGAARWWSNRISRFQDYAEENMQGRVLEVKYEDMIGDPGAAFERMAKFYGVFSEQAHARLLEATQAKSGNSGNWRAQFSVGEVEMFERVAGAALSSNGYELASGASSPLPASQHMAWRAYEAVYSRLGFYPLWFRGLRIINRLIGMSPKLQQRFHRSALFENHFNWNKKMGIDKKE